MTFVASGGYRTNLKSVPAVSEGAEQFDKVYDEVSGWRRGISRNTEGCFRLARRVNHGNALGGPNPPSGSAKNRAAAGRAGLPVAFVAGFSITRGRSGRRSPTVHQWAVPGMLP